MLVVHRHVSKSPTPYRTIVVQIPPSTETRLLTFDLLEETGTGSRIGIQAPKDISILRGEIDRDLYDKAAAH
jgi:hypothetical protein